MLLLHRQISFPTGVQKDNNVEKSITKICATYLKPVNLNT